MIPIKTASCNIDNPVEVLRSIIKLLMTIINNNNRDSHGAFKNNNTKQVIRRNTPWATMEVSTYRPSCAPPTVFMIHPNCISTDSFIPSSSNKTCDIVLLIVVNLLCISLYCVLI